MKAMALARHVAADRRDTTGGQEAPARRDGRPTPRPGSPRLFALRRPPGAAIAGAAVCGLAAWATAGQLATTGTDVSSRVALLGPWWMAASVTGALLLLGAVSCIPSRAWWPTLLPAVLLLPWLPFPVPAAWLLWVGPIAAWVWAGTAIAVACAWWPGRQEPGDRVRTTRRMSLSVLALGVALYSAGALAVWRVLPAGDAPHYLVITQSLLLDHDLRIENNHAREDYAAYFSGVLKPDYLRRGSDRQIYSIHAPGLPVLVAPAFAAGGYPAVVFFLALVSALGAWLLWRTALALTGDVAAAWFGWASVSLSAPFFLHAFQAFPDATGAVLTMTGVAAIVALEDPRKRRSIGGEAAPLTAPAGDANTGTWFGWLRGEGAPAAGRWLLHGAALAYLPWLHTRYAAIAVVLGACVALRLVNARRFRELAAFAAIPVASAVAWFSFFHVVYGSFSPAAPYGSYTQSSAGNIVTALPALLFDQQFGLVPNAPAYLPALIGLVLMFGRRRRLAIELGLVAFTYLAAVASYNMWWGGWSAPARFAVPVLLLLGLPAAEFWARRGSAGRAAGLTALGVSLFITVTFEVAEGGRLIFNSRDGFSRWMEWIAPLADLPRGVPSFLRAGAAPAWAQTAIWAVVLALACIALTREAARAADAATRRAGLAGAAPVVFAAAATIASAICWNAIGAEGMTPTSGQLRLLRGANDGWRTAAVQYRPLRAMAPSDLLLRLHLETSSRRPPRPAVPLLMTSLPAGIYRIRPTDPSGRAADLDVKIGRSAKPLDRCSADQVRAGACLLSVPAETSAVTVTSGGASGAPGGAVQLQPLRVRPEPPRPALGGTPGSGSEGPVSRAARYGTNAVFTFDELVYLEDAGFWITGARDDLVIVAPDTPAPSVPLLVRNGANPNVITLRTSGWTRQLSLAPRQEQVIAVPVDAASGAVALRVHPAGGFRPADLEAGNKDRRYLGAWLAVAGGAR